eukprot:7371840-Prymnesium_polylepis.2
MSAAESTDSYGNAYRYVTVDPAPTPSPEMPASIASPARVIRVLCLHGAYLRGEILRYSLAPVERAFKKRGIDGVGLELVFPEGHQQYEVAAMQERAAADPDWRSAMSAELTAITSFELEHVFMWADNDDRAAHGGREFSNIPHVLAHLQALLKKHTPIDGILGSKGPVRRLESATKKHSRILRSPCDFPH